MADERENDVDAGWDDIDAGWDVQASKPEPAQHEEPAARRSEKITAESDALPTMIPVPIPPAPEPAPEPRGELFKASEPKPRADEGEAGFIEDDVTANRLYDDALLAKVKRDDGVVTVRPLSASDGAQARPSAARPSNS